MMEGIYKSTIIDRINKMLSDNQFRQYCEDCKKNNINFEYEIKIAEKIARLDISHITIDENLIHMNTPFTEDEVDSQILAFYRALDKICPEGMQLEKTAKENMQYLSHDITKEKSPRSYCCTKFNNDGTAYKKIFVNIEGRIGDISNACHEVCHSLSQSFTKMKKMRDTNMQEVATVMVDVFSNEFLKTRYPHLRVNFIENSILTQIQNVMKAREVLLDGLVIKLMLGETTIDELKKNYGDLYLQNTRILSRCLDNIEKKEFSNMFEKRYLLPQAISQIMLERLMADPNNTVKQFKTIIEHDTEWSIKDTLQNIGLGSVTEVFDDYIDNFKERTQKLVDEKNLIQKMNKDNELSID